GASRRNHSYHSRKQARQVNLLLLVRPIFKSNRTMSAIPSPSAGLKIGFVSQEHSMAQSSNPIGFVWKKRTFAPHRKTVPKHISITAQNRVFYVLPGLRSGRETRGFSNAF